MTPAPVPWRVIAQNLPEHANNRIHTDEGARAAGFPAALVAGVTTYAYLTHPLIAAWGLDWVRSGGGEVRFRAPVHAGDTVDVVPRDADGVTVVDALVDGDRKATLRASVDGLGWTARPGEVLRPYHVTLEGQFGPDYGARTGDDLGVCELAGVVHPAVWPALANYVVARELVRGSWIHTRSRITHHALASAGASATIRTTVIDRFVRSGQRAVVDVEIEVDGVIVATLEHEAIVDLEPSHPDVSPDRPTTPPRAP